MKEPDKKREAKLALATAVGVLAALLMAITAVFLEFANIILR